MDGAGSAHARTDTAFASAHGASTETLAGGCINPIRLRGYHQLIAADTGEVLSQLGTADSSSVLLVSCKDRRASCCPSCARLYERDAYHHLVAGLRGGKTVPTSVSAHPAIMLTLTAPSFGPVHGNRDHDQRCRCGQKHDPEDPLTGTAIDPNSYRYAEQVLWNHYAPELWKRTIQAVRRHLAKQLGVPRSKLSHIVRVRFAKVGEFQRRGVVHYHAIIRVDGPHGIATAPPASCTLQLLVEVVEAAADAAAVVVPQPLRGELAAETSTKLRWGTQREAVALDPRSCTAAASYIAKYATKATETATSGTLIRPLRSVSSLAHLPIASHPRALITASWRLGERTGDKRFKRWAHQFGYGGHTLTKSRHYSVTFAALRAARASWHLGTTEGDVIVRAHLTYGGRLQPHQRGPR
jgi:hypothetical protein